MADKMARQAADERENQNSREKAQKAQKRKTNPTIAPNPESFRGNILRGQMNPDLRRLIHRTSQRAQRRRFLTEGNEDNEGGLAP
jgi:hypothetical protein